MLKYGNKSRLRKDARSLASFQPLSFVFMVGRRLVMMVTMVTTSLSMPIHMRFASSSPHPPNCNKVTEKASLLPRV